MSFLPLSGTTARIAAVFALCLLSPDAALHAQHDDHQHAMPMAMHHDDSATVAALAKQLEAVRKATAKYSDLEAAKRDGYVQFGREERPLMGEHWFRKDLVNQPLDLARPSTLQYATINGKLQLVGVAFTVYQKPNEAVPEGFAGSSDMWHVHDLTKMATALTEGRPLAAFLVRNRMNRTNAAMREGRTQLAMVHAWTALDNPDGVFAEHHRALPYLQAGLPASYAVGATENAAWGIALIQSNGCTTELNQMTAVAQASAAQKKELQAACAVAQKKVNAAYQAKKPASELNATSDSAWSGYLAERDRTLSSAQKERLNSMVEHPMSGG
jgi:hypothetical protein